MSDQKEMSRRPETGAAQKVELDTINPSTIGAVRNKLPSDVRVLRLISALYGLIVFDRSGGEPLWAYSFEEIGECFDFLKHTDLEQLKSAIAECARLDGNHVVRLAQVLDFPEKGKP
jgi:hypothetical protein